MRPSKQELWKMMHQSPEEYNFGKLREDLHSNMELHEHMAIALKTDGFHVLQQNLCKTYSMKKVVILKDSLTMQYVISFHTHTNKTLKVRIDA